MFPLIVLFEIDTVAKLRMKMPPPSPALIVLLLIVLLTIETLAGLPEKMEPFR